MATTKSTPSSFVNIHHTMTDDEKKLFRILFEHALPDLETQEEHAIHTNDLIKLWRTDTNAFALERAFWNLGATITYQCLSNPYRPSWGTFALFYDRSMKGDGVFYYSYNQEFKKMLSYPIVHKELLQAGLITEASDRLPSFSESLSVLASF
jgi:hypothetical protein